jgi:AraC family transcriptional regulator, regulatory protein of adaptative response / DNA-3-methyladenine glycosylase II
VGSRHLRRLFLKHVGATPSAVVKTRRLQFAKQLIDQTRMPMGQVALAAGFGCVRRFNAAIRDVYHRTPTEIRRLVPRSTLHPGKEYIFRLQFRPPYNWQRTLEFLEAHSIPSVEAVHSGTYRRSIFLKGKGGCFEISFDGPNQALLLSIEFPDPSCLFFIIERIRTMFDLNADWSVIARALGADGSLARLIEANRGLRAPGCWNGFELATQAILTQGSNDKAARHLAGRMARTFGRRFADAGPVTHFFPEPDALIHADLTGLGVRRPQAEAIRGLARSVRDRRIQFEGVLDGSAFLEKLCEVRGVDRSVGEYVAMRSGRDPDAFPADMLKLRSAIASTRSGLERRSEAWRPWRAYAALLLWQRATKLHAAAGWGEAQTERAGNTSTGATLVARPAGS